jgi:hypothetical protein
MLPWPVANIRPSRTQEWDRLARIANGNHWAYRCHDAQEQEFESASLRARIEEPHRQGGRHVGESHLIVSERA